MRDFLWTIRETYKKGFEKSEPIPLVLDESKEYVPHHLIHVVCLSKGFVFIKRKSKRLS